MKLKCIKDYYGGGLDKDSSNLILKQGEEYPILETDDTGIHSFFNSMGILSRYHPDFVSEYLIEVDSEEGHSDWSDKHYDHYYTLTEEDIEAGKIKLDVYTVSNVWGIGSKDDSGALWHTFKIFPRFGEKNSEEREIKAMYEQVKALAKVKGVKLEEDK